MASSIEARIISITGEEVYRIIGNTERGSILSAQFEWEKIGGLRNFELTIARNNEVPLFSGMRFDFYFRDDIFLTNTKIFSGYSEITPSRETSENIIAVSGKGYYWQLEERLVNDNYVGKSIQEIIEDLDLTDMDISLSTNIVPPSGVYNVNFKDRTYLQVLNTLLMIANAEYATSQYIWYVDENRELNFHILTSTGSEVAQKFFEGYDFQNPEVDFDKKIINRVLMYRATSASSKESEFVATYNNTDSQGKNGIKEDKFVLGDYLDNTGIAEIAEGILSEYAEPKKSISIKNFYRKDSDLITGLIAYNDGTDDDTMIVNVGFGNQDFEYRISSLSEERFRRIWLSDYYGISTKPQEKITLVNECDDLTGWTQNIPNSTIITSDDTVLTGRQVFKWTRSASQPAGDYIELDLTNIIGNLIDVRFNVYFVDYVADITFSFFDIEGNQVDIIPDISNGSLINKWLKFTEDTRAILEEGLLHVQKTATPFSPLAITSNSVDSSLLITHTDTQVIRNLAKVKITLGAGTINPDIIYIDRIEAKNKAWEYSRLTLDKAVYTIDKDYVVSDMEFGNRKLSIVDEIKDGVKKGDLAFDMFANN